MKSRRRAFILLALLYPMRFWLYVTHAKIRVRPFVHPSTEPHRFGEHHDPIRLLVLGDSIGAGVGCKLEDSMSWQLATKLSSQRAVELTIRAVSGSCGRDVLFDQIPAAADDNPDVVLICVGTNDVAQLVFMRSNFELLATEYEELIRTARSMWPEAQIVLTGAGDVQSLRTYGRLMRQLADKRARELNRLIDKLAEEYGVNYVPLAKLVSDEFRNTPGCFSVDRFHPSALGYGILAQKLEAPVRQAAAAVGKI